MSTRDIETECKKKRDKFMNERNIGDNSKDNCQMGETDGCWEGKGYTYR